jgi:hypothetical protein
MREALRKQRAWDKKKIEAVITIELTWNLRKERNARVIPFLRPIDAVKKLGTKGQPWYFHQIGELMRIHPLQPEIDIFYLEFGKPTDIEFPKFCGTEIKYFAPTARYDLNARYEKPFYEGIGEAMALLTLGLDYASLWHFFDQNMLNKFLAENYAKFVQHMISSLNLPIGYRARWVKIDQNERKVEFSEFENVINVEPKINPLLSKDLRIDKLGILVPELDPLRLSVIRTGLNKLVV